MGGWLQISTCGKPQHKVTRGRSFFWQCRLGKRVVSERACLNQRVCTLKRHGVDTQKHWPNCQCSQSKAVLWHSFFWPNTMCENVPSTSVIMMPKHFYKQHLIRGFPLPKSCLETCTIMVRAYHALRTPLSASTGLPLSKVTHLHLPGC